MKKDNISRPLPLRGGGWGVRLHHLKIAFRNMWKFRVQTVVCVLGLSVGMACFALGTLWLRYIESFEDFVPDAENTYFVSTGVDKMRGGYGYYTHILTGQDLMENSPVVTDYCTFTHHVHAKNHEANAYIFSREGNESVKLITNGADTAFFRFFGIEAIEGSLSHLTCENVVLTESAAKRIFGKESALGKRLTVEDNGNGIKPFGKKDVTVTAIIPDCPKNTQFYYEAIIKNDDVAVIDYPRGSLYFNTLVKLNPKADLDSIVGKPYKLAVRLSYNAQFGSYSEREYEYMFIPLRELRKDYPYRNLDVSTTYVRWFMLLGALVILCSVVNYLITMVNHLRRRAWEMSLRRVLGASIKTILAMVSTETLLTFLAASVLGWFFVWAVLPYFREYSSIDIPLSDIFWKIFGYLTLVIAVGCAVSALVAWFVMKKTQRNILGARQLKHSSTLLDRVGVILQLALSMGIIFSVSIMLHQVNYMMYSDELGFNRSDAGVVYWTPEEIKHRIKHSPLTVSTYEGAPGIFPRQGTMGYSVGLDEEADYSTYVYTEFFEFDSLYVDFFELQFVAGRLPIFANLKHESFIHDDIVGFDMDEDGTKILTEQKEYYPIEVAINETLCRAFGHTPQSIIGENLYDKRGFYRVSGVLKDSYVLGPPVQPNPMLFILKGEKDDEFGMLYGDFNFKTLPGRAQELCDSIGCWKEELGVNCSVQNIETEYAEYVKSEQLLIRILLAVALCSLFVCVLGAFSLVSLSLTERRKEIAIRKAHGAHISDILQLFLRSHYLSLAIAALVAYPLSYIIMRSWLEHYTKQVGIDWWIIPATFLLISLVVIATISAKIYLAAKEKAARALAG